MSAPTSEVTIPDFSLAATFQPGVPHDAFDELRRRPGLYWQPTEIGTRNGGFWVVTRFEDIVEVEKHPELFTSEPGTAYPATVVPSGSFLEDLLMFMDPPRHSSVRRAAAVSFSPRVVKNFDSWIREIVCEVLDGAIAEGEFDWCVDVAQMIPSLVMARVLGVPRADRMSIVNLTLEQMIAQQKVEEGGQVDLGAIFNAMLDYVGVTLLEEKSRNPADDMATMLLGTVERGELTHNEAQFFLLLLLSAGFETTFTLMSQTMRMIVEDPTVAEDVRRGIAELGADSVTNEFLRFITPAMNQARTATVDTVIAGQEVSEGDLLQLMFVAAGRDPQVFADPHTFNPWRTEKESLVFGSGAHRCMGNALARLEMKILFEELAARELVLRPNGQPRRGLSTFINSLQSLPVAVVSSSSTGRA